MYLAGLENDIAQFRKDKAALDAERFRKEQEELVAQTQVDADAGVSAAEETVEFDADRRYFPPSQTRAPHCLLLGLSLQLKQEVTLSAGDAAVGSLGQYPSESQREASHQNPVIAATAATPTVPLSNGKEDLASRGYAMRTLKQHIGSSSIEDSGISLSTSQAEPSSGGFSLTQKSGSLDSATSKTIWSLARDTARWAETAVGQLLQHANVPVHSAGGKPHEAGVESKMDDSKAPQLAGHVLHLAEAVVNRLVEEAAALGAAGAGKFPSSDRRRLGQQDDDELGTSKSTSASHAADVHDNYGLDGMQGESHEHADDEVGVLSRTATGTLHSLPRRDVAQKGAGGTVIRRVALTSTGGEVYATGHGEVYATGYNGNGQLGDGTTTNRYSPVRVMAGHHVVQAAAWRYHTVFVTSGRCWAFSHSVCDIRIGEARGDAEELMIAAVMRAMACRVGGNRGLSRYICKRDGAGTSQDSSGRASTLKGLVTHQGAELESRCGSVGRLRLEAAAAQGQAESSSHALQLCAQAELESRAADLWAV
ncbi:hypothetical protein CYMTET_22534 [Cymbomonas tetramitiformis]|uniref:Uncharacterized protein n=1 Tax=Cymbomonas tetramitiformis TaxID=36881 RepID=A0AAE0L1T7_9CHLO|nr:hypothetical protein CYMTET_22534 [Cymbomonas tetramitiformis]